MKDGSRSIGGGMIALCINATTKDAAAIAMQHREK